MTPKREELMVTLIMQVKAARPAIGTERDVTTFISRPMWKKWLSALGTDVNAEPSGWYPDARCNRVYGSETIVVESDAMFSVSIATKQLMLMRFTDSLNKCKFFI